MLEHSPGRNRIDSMLRSTTVDVVDGQRSYIRPLAAISNTPGSSKSIKNLLTLVALVNGIRFLLADLAVTRNAIGTCLVLEVFVDGFRFPTSSTSLFEHAMNLTNLPANCKRLG